MMTKPLMILTSLAVLVACGGQKTAVHPQAMRPSLEDFVWSGDSGIGGGKETGEPANCRDHIKGSLCLVDGMGDGDQTQCQDGGMAYASPFEALYDAYPPAVQKMFCSLKVIYIMREFGGTAFGGLLEDANGNITGAQMGIRKSLLDENLDLHTWASWKEQLSFGGVKDSYTLRSDLPHAKTSTAKKNVNDFLYFVVAHEFGHMFDFSNHLNRLENCSEPSDPNAEPECEMAAGSWGSLSWKTSLSPHQENDFLNRSGLCFYFCDGNTLAKSVIPALYADLYDRTSFLSAYAATDAWQEFADSLAYYLMHKYFGNSYVLDTKQGQQYDVMAKTGSTEFSRHYQYIEDFLTRSDIVYP